LYCFIKYRIIEVIFQNLIPNHMTQEDVDRIENEKALAKLRAEQDKALAEAKKAEDEKIAEPIEFKELEEDLPPAGPAAE
jgi:hypothetical protein